MSLPPFGNAAQAFDANWVHMGRTFNVCEVVIRSGFIIVILGERISGAASSEQTITITSSLNRVQFGDIVLSGSTTTSSAEVEQASSNRTNLNLLTRGIR